jgi:hypothetical protein
MEQFTGTHETLLMVTNHYVNRLQHLDGENRKWFPTHDDPITADTKQFHEELGTLLGVYTGKTSTK